MKLSTQLIAGILILLIVVTGIFTVVGITTIQDSLKEKIGENQLVLAEVTMSEIDRTLYGGLKDIKIVAESEGVEDYVAEIKEGEVGTEVQEEFDRELDESLLLTGPWDALFIVDKKGIIIASTHKDEVGDSIDEEPLSKIAYQAALQGKSYYSDLILSEDTGRPTIIFAAPIKDEGEIGRPIKGVAIGNFAWPVVVEILEKLDASAHLFNQKGQLLASNYLEHKKEYLSKSHRHHPLIEHALMQKEMHMVTESFDYEFEVLIAHVKQQGYLSYEGSDWFLFLETPTKQAFDVVSFAQMIFLLVASVIIVSGSLFTFFLSRSITKPILSLTQSNKDIVRGEYKKAQQQQQQQQKHIPTEIAELIQARQHMLKGLVQRGILVKERKKLEQANKNLKKAYAKLKELSKMKEDLISIVGHELRTPLTSIFSLSQLIHDGEMGPTTKEQKESLELVLNDTKRLKQLIENTLDVTRFEAGQIKYNLSTFNLLNIVKEAVKTTPILAKEKHIGVEFAKQEKVNVKADSQRMTQVIINLITNAIKYGKKGGHVWISVSQKGNEAIVSIKDDGRGIAKKDMPNLFDKLYSADQSAKRVPGGLGLGLYISKNIIDDHKGKMWVESELGKGSTFYFSLPVEQVIKTQPDRKENKQKITRKQQKF